MTQASLPAGYFLVVSLSIFGFRPQTFSAGVKTGQEGGKLASFTVAISIVLLKITALGLRKVWHMIIPYDGQKSTNYISNGDSQTGSCKHSAAYLVRQLSPILGCLSTTSEEISRNFNRAATSRPLCPPPTIITFGSSFSNSISFLRFSAHFPWFGFAFLSGPILSGNPFRSSKFVNIAWAFHLPSDSGTSRKIPEQRPTGV